MTFRTITLRTGLSLAAASLFVYACSGDDTSATKGATDSGTDTGAVTTRPDSSTGADSSSGGTDAGTSDGSNGSDTGTTDTGTTTEAGVDAAPPATTIAYAGCVDPDAGADGGSGTLFQDFGALDAVVTFGGAVGESYSPKCIKIKAGHMVTWNGDFSGHPLSGAPNNPASPQIPTTSSGTTQSVTFPSAGVYGFYCQFHGVASGSAAAMNGVVLVE